MSNPRTPRNMYRRTTPQAPDSEASQEELISHYEGQISELQIYMESLEGEISELRHRLSAAPRESSEAEIQLFETTRDLIKAHRRNQRLTTALREAQEQLKTAKEYIEKLEAPPNNYGIFLNTNEDGTIDIDLGGRKYRVNAAPNMDIHQFKKGQEVIVNVNYNVVASKDFDLRENVQWSSFP